MKILVNGTTLVIGGGLNVGRSLIVELARAPRGHIIRYVTSRELSDILPAEIDRTVIPVSPARPFSGRKSRALLREIERAFRPDVVLTIFGPSYWKPKAAHVCGFADPWLFTSNMYAWYLLDSKRRLFFKLQTLYKKKALFLGDTRALIVETNAVAQAIKSLYPFTAVSVIPNNCGQAFFDQRASSDGHNPIMPPKEKNEFRVVTLSQYYRHKNLEIIPEIAAVIRGRLGGSKPRFYLPLDPDSSAWRLLAMSAQRLGVGDNVCTVGVVQPQMAPFFYEGADAMLLPSVLECFSANYPEAMKTGVPIITTDLPFAHSVCKDAALYFEPLNARSAGQRLIDLHDNTSLMERLVERGKVIVADLPSPPRKAGMYIDVCESLLK
jgi:glycosyltransferase involved in cell wall biosynthesis